MAVLARAQPLMAAGSSSRHASGAFTGRTAARLYQLSAPSPRLLCRAEGQQDSGAPSAPPQAPPAPETQRQEPSSTAQQPSAQQPKSPPQAPLLAPGQGTAIVTGAVSVLFGVAYLVLVQLMDMRGGELQPPPPEAFIP